MGRSTVSWFKRSPTLVNSCLSFLIAMLTGLWINWWTGDTKLSLGAHSVLVVALFLLIIQIGYNRWTDRADRELVDEVLAMVHCFLVDHAKAAVRDDAIRLMVHRVGYARPGKNAPRQRCLIVKYQHSPVKPRDCGPIPIDDDHYGQWYVNVKSFHQQKLVSEEPVPQNRPIAADHFINTPSLFNGVSVMAVPIMIDRAPPVFLGTLTVDSRFDRATLNWPRSGFDEPLVERYLLRAADLIARIEQS